MEKVVEMNTKMWDKVEGIKSNKTKKTCLDIILILLIVPISLIMLFAGMNALLGLMVCSFNFIFFMWLIIGSVCMLTLVKMSLIILYLNNLIERG